ncbi:Coenzyme F420 hydrogenase/dehydrogenase, beta subunit C-terminal domain [Marinicrinis sediminis]|uniref:Coenzyme F420 hydrogenase/dehydrogenase, beta subunit C-terminal domain n=1 Tax=Marinicrinis sediminis TaxID=1652465 RepID=A0ABW5R8K9_9BACL
MSFMTLYRDIIEPDLCTSCGLCEAVCPKDVVGFHATDSIPLPWFKGEMNEVLDVCQDCTLCSDICPGYDTGVPQTEERMFARTRSEEERWTGIYRYACQLTASSPDILQKASAGGAGTTLAITALTEGLADAVIVVGRDEEEPWRPRAFLADSVDQIIESAQSSYCITPNLHLLKETHYEKIGLIGVPCQIQGIQKLLNHGEQEALKTLADRIQFTIELGCASSTAIAGTEHIITDLLHLSLDEVQEMKYRDGGYPGEFKVITKAGEEHRLPFFRLVEEFKAHKTFRCLTCPDWWSGVADISISDGDPNIFESSKFGGNHAPSSTVLVRTEMGEQLMNLGLAKGHFTLKDYTFINNLGLERKRQRYRHYETNSARKIPLPPVHESFSGDILSDDEVIAVGIRNKT